MALLTNNIAPGFLECPWTQAWAKLLRPDYSLPGRTTFNDTLCPKAVELLKRMMEEKIANILSFCVSFDGWSSTAVRGYLGVIAHGIDQHWKLECFFLALRRVTSAETADVGVGTRHCYRWRECNEVCNRAAHREEVVLLYTAFDTSRRAASERIS